MGEASVVWFREEQRSEKWFMPVFAITGLGCAFVFGQLGVWILAAKFGVSNASSYAPWITAGFALFYLFYALVMIPRMFRLVTEVREDGIYVQFGRTPFRQIPLDGIVSVEVSKQKVAPGPASILEITKTNTRKGNVYRLSGSRGIRVIYEDGSDVFIGSQKPEELVEAIRAVVGE